MATFVFNRNHKVLCRSCLNEFKLHFQAALLRKREDILSGRYCT